MLWMTTSTPAEGWRARNAASAVLVGPKFAMSPAAMYSSYGDATVEKPNTWILVPVDATGVAVAGISAVSCHRTEASKLLAVPNPNIVVLVAELDDKASQYSPGFKALTVAGVTNCTWFAVPCTADRDVMRTPGFP